MCGVPVTYLSRFREEYIAGNGFLRLVINGESAFSLGDEGDVVVGQSMYTTFGQEFSGVAKFYYINQKFASVLRLIEGILGDSAFHFLSKK